MISEESFDSERLAAPSAPADSELSGELYAELLAAQRRRDDYGWENSNLAAVCRRMTPQQKLQAAERMFWNSRRAKADEIQRQNPGWSGEQVEQELRIVMFAEAMRKEF